MPVVNGAGIKIFSCKSNTSTGLAIEVDIEITVSILFGLEIWAFAAIQLVKEVLMNNSIVLSCVWCGVAFLRGQSGTLPIQMRGYQLHKCLPC